MSVAALIYALHAPPDAHVLPVSAATRAWARACAEPSHADSFACAEDILSSTTYAIYKPRNVLSAAGPSAGKSGRKNNPTLTDVMEAAGVRPLPGHVGRLDAETSGLILVTDN